MNLGHQGWREFWNLKRWQFTSVNPHEARTLLWIRINSCSTNGTVTCAFIKIQRCWLNISRNLVVLHQNYHSRWRSRGAHASVGDTLGFFHSLSLCLPDKAQALSQENTNLGAQPPLHLCIHLGVERRAMQMGTSASPEGSAPFPIFSPTIRGSSTSGRFFPPAAAEPEWKMLPGAELLWITLYSKHTMLPKPRLLWGTLQKLWFISTPGMLLVLPRFLGRFRALEEFVEKHLCFVYLAELIDNL